MKKQKESNFIVLAMLIILSLNSVVAQNLGEEILKLNAFAASTCRYDPKRADSIARVCIEDAKLIGFHDGLARSYNIIGLANFYLGNYTEACQYYDSCIIYGEKTGSKVDVCKAVNNMTLLLEAGLVIERNKLRSNLLKTIQYYDPSVQYAALFNNFKVYVYYNIKYGETEIIKDLDYIIQSCSDEDKNIFAPIFAASLAYMNSLLNNNHQAIEYYEKAVVNIANDIPFKWHIYNEIGLLLFKSKMFKETISFMEQSVIELKSTNLRDLDLYLVFYYHNIGNSFAMTGDFLNAIRYYKQIEVLNAALACVDKQAFYNNFADAYIQLDSLKIAKKYVDSLIQSPCYDHISDIKILIENTQLQYYYKVGNQQKTDSLLSHLEHYSDSILWNYAKSQHYFQIGKIYEGKGNYEKALKYIKCGFEIERKDYEEGIRYKLLEIKTQYETTAKELKIKTQEELIKKQKMNFIILFIATILLLLLITYSTIQRIKKDKAYRFLLSKAQREGILKADMGYVSISTQVEESISDEENSTKRYQNSALSYDEKNILKNKLITKLLKEKLYTRTDLNLILLARECDTNRTYMSQIINEEFHCNFTQLINKLRIEYAMELLSSDENILPIKAIYENIGFNSLSTFYDAFYKQTGLTPSYFRRKQKKVNVL